MTTTPDMATVAPPLDVPTLKPRRPFPAYFLSLVVPATWQRTSWKAAPPSASPIMSPRIAARTAEMLNARDLHKRLSEMCPAGLHVVRVMPLEEVLDEPEHLCPTDPTLRPSFGPDPHGRSYHVALVRPKYGTLATSPAKWPPRDSLRSR